MGIIYGDPETTLIAAAGEPEHAGLPRATDVSRYLQQSVVIKVSYWYLFSTANLLRKVSEMAH